MKRGSLADERPELASQWAPINALSPSNVSCGSHKKVWWVCDKGHTWEATVKNRALIGSGCPYCEHRAVLKGYNDLQTINPELAGTWSPNNSLNPSDVSPYSNTEVLWICENGHEWSARIADRSEGHGCPYCAGHKVWRGYNDLATTHPDLLSEWSDKNKGISPETITYKNRSNVWWRCSKCGNDYQAVVYARANGRICPFCIASEIQRLRKERLLKRKIAKDFEYLLPQLATIYYAGKHDIKILTDTETFIGLSVTAYMPEIRMIIDVCSSRKEIKLKKYISNINKVKYINISERLPEAESINEVRRAFSVVHIYITTDPKKDLEILRKHFTSWKETNSDG